MTNTNYKTALEPVIAASWFTLDAGTYVYARVEKVSAPEKHLLIVRDGIEITVVTDVSHLPLDGEHKVNKERWKLINIRCGNPFYCVGFIAYITDTLAMAGIDIVITSSFSNDLILVIDKDLEQAVGILKDAGFKHV